MKKKVLVIFGGKSGEHAVSVMSAKSIEKFIDREKYEPLFLGITETGRWSFGKSVEELIGDGKVLTPSSTMHLPSTDVGTSLEIVNTTEEVSEVKFDVVFSVVHGTNGEDGRLQGFLDMVNVPYVGSGVLGSALSMDKVIQKTLCANSEIPQAKFEWFTHRQWLKNPQKVLDTIKTKLNYPVFIKPANLGSSVGITKVKKPEDLNVAIEEAFRYDNKILIEQGINDIKEIEVGVLGNNDPKVSVCGEIIPKTEFYDYETKYVTNAIDSHIPAKIPDNIVSKIQEIALKAFHILNCKGLARIDFFYQPKTEKIFLSEVNTMPGFTHISMYPKVWEASGIAYTDLISNLIVLGEEEWREKQRLEYSFK